MSYFKIFMIAAAMLVLSSSLCGCTRRAVTMTSWWENYVYIGYWEGSCSPFGCSKGKPQVKRCNVNDDNSVTCVQETELEALLQGEGGGETAAE